ncbi:uncharacterized protein KGF55_004846 [Candida pseudojiufengensis]|uniref:uncharacterized protein n=1 Tax=Candida pseudojiufengensis TaxID=497109 RepID=UPI00222536AB|nr:uncharacterized protein KGF55_004846 [Candida pseudojiufengensis]KAI5960123.1 hypothetical protein KGF55_004846 [Candida pseudojiufengensis]
MTEVSTPTNEFPNTESVDELFTKLSIPELQQKSTKYKSIINNTKNELHDLVSNKYRDLIKIAEDISVVQQQTSQIDGNLQELSYKPSAFVSPYNDKSQKFNNYLINNQALKIQQNTRSIVVKNILQKRLNKLNSKISHHGPSPLLHTSHFISFVQELYTINTVFQDVLEKDKSVLLQLQSVKNNLLEYFKFEMKVYKVSESILSSSDKFRSSQRLSEEDLIKSDSNQDDDIFEDEENDSDEDENKNSKFDMISSSKLNSADQNTSPLCNYLVCYTILENEIGNSSKIREDFLKFRIAYISHLITTLKPKNNINFYTLFKYLENTCRYVKSYFEENGDYFRLINNINKPWSVTSMVGFKDWLEDTILEFEVKETETTESNSLQQNIISFLRDSSLVSWTSNEKIISFEEVLKFVNNFYEYFISLKKLEENMEFSGVNSNLIEIISNTNLLGELTETLISTIRIFCQQHISTLNDVNGIYGSLKQLLSNPISSKTNKFGFDLEFVNLMDYNVDDYISNVSNQTSLNFSTKVTQDLHDWIHHFNKIRQLTNLEQEVSYSITSQEPQSTDLPRLYQTLKNDEVIWGEFSSNTLKSGFEELYKEIITLFEKEVLQLCDSIEKLSNDQDKVDKLFFLLGLIHDLDTGIDSNTIDYSKITKRMNGVITKIYEKIIKLIFDSEINEAIDQNVQEILKLEGNEIPTTPSLRFASTLYELAQNLLTRSSTIEARNINTFIKDPTSNLFIEIKNNWIKSLAEKYFETVIDKIEEARSSVTEETESQGYKITKTQGLKILANQIFILQFNHTSIEKLNFKTQISKLAEFCESAIDENSLKVTISEVSSYFKSKKNIYLPLSLNIEN